MGSRIIHNHLSLNVRGIELLSKDTRLALFRIYVVDEVTLRQTNTGKSFPASSLYTFSLDTACLSCVNACEYGISGFYIQIT